MLGWRDSHATLPLPLALPQTAATANCQGSSNALGATYPTQGPPGQISPMPKPTSSTPKRPLALVGVWAQGAKPPRRKGSPHCHGPAAVRDRMVG